MSPFRKAFDEQVLAYVAAEFYAQARSIEGTPEFKAAVQAGAQDMAHCNRERETLLMSPFRKLMSPLRKAFEEQVLAYVAAGVEREALQVELQVRDLDALWVEGYLPFDDFRENVLTYRGVAVKVVEGGRLLVTQKKPPA